MSSPVSSVPGTPSSSHGSDALLILTPRSKIRALMESLNDSSSDDEPRRSPTRKPRLGPTTADTLLFPRHQNGLREETRDRQLPPTRPHGKLASAMYGAAAVEDDDDDAGAYERVKKSLMARTKDSNVSSAPKVPETQVDSLPDDGEDDDIPIAPRRKRTLKTTASSPVSPPARSSPRSSATPTQRSIVDSDSDALPEDPFKDPDFMARVEEKKEEHRQKEAADREREQELRKRRSRENELGVGQSGSDDDAGKEVTRAPRRKAGKKAMEELHKETQRMARNMQLEHEARTRKKITKQSLFDKFNFKTEASEPAAAPEPQPPAKKSPIVESEPEIAPRSTSPYLDLSQDNQVEEEKSEDLPEPVDIFNSTQDVTTPKQKNVEDNDRTLHPRFDKGKGKAIESPPRRLDKGKTKAVKRSPPSKKASIPFLKVHLPIRTLTDDSDSDLEIVNPQKEAQKETKRLLSEKQKLISSLRKPRHIPVASALPNRRIGVTPKQLHLQLLEQSRLQAITQREERIEELKAKGVIVQTAEEREKEQQEVETLLEKARKDALEIKRREKKERSKGEKVSDNERNDSEEDFDWMEEEEDEIDSELLGEDDLEFSGDDDEEQQNGNRMIDEEAESGSGKEDVEMKDIAQDDPKSPAFSLSSVNQDRDSISPTPRLSDMPAAFVDDEDCDDDDGGFAPFKRKLARKKQRVTDEDDEEENQSNTEIPGTSDVSRVPDIFKNEAQTSGIGMTQLFAGTMAGSGLFSTVGDMGKKIEGMRKLPDEVLPNSQAPVDVDDPDSVPDTQVGDLRLDLHYSQSQSDSQDPLPELKLDYGQSQVEYTDSQQFPDPTQDSGFEKISSPAPPRFGATQESPPGTFPTQLLDEQFPEPKKSRGRLRRAADFSDEEKESDADDEDDGDLEDAFMAVGKGTKKLKNTAKPFDKTKSEAKNMVHEQADESEDEYAGIGGGSDDEEGDVGHDEEMKDLLDDEHHEVDEMAMAAFFAERDKLQDEKDVNKLFRDLQNGMLRKKRGAGFDLDDDSDDEYMAQERRRRAKKRQIAQIRQALIQNESIGKIADDPKKAAFFKILEDNASDEDGDFLDQTEEDLFANLADSQSQLESNGQTQEQGGAEQPPDSQASSAGDARPQIRDRRPVRAKRPGLAEIRETLSFLGVEENSTINLSDSEDSEGDSQRRRTTTTVIDRTLSRSSTSVSVTTKLAFQTTESGVTGFKVPALLRRATTTGSVESQGSATTERSLGDSQGLKKGGTKSSSINFVKAKAARGVEVGEKKKKMEREKEGRARARAGLGLFAAGSFS